MSGRRASAPPRQVSRWVKAVPIFAAVVVGAASFTLSFFAQSEVSAELGAVPAQWSWLVPIIVDGGVLAGSASVWSSSTRGARKDPIAYLTIVGLLALSVIVNVHHASAAGGTLGAVIAGAPPVVLLLCLELVAAQARRDAVDALAAAVPDDDAVVNEPAPAPVATAPVVAAPPTARHPEPVRAPAPLTAVPAPVAAWAPSPEPGAAAVVAMLPARPRQPEPGAALRAEPLADLPTPVEVTELTAPVEPGEEVAAAETVAVEVAPQRATDAPAPRPGSQAEQIRALFAEHVNAGGDALDKNLARTISERLDAPLPSVRKVVAHLRREMDPASA